MTYHTLVKQIQLHLSSYFPHAVLHAEAIHLDYKTNPLFPLYQNYISTQWNDHRHTKRIQHFLTGRLALHRALNKINHPIQSTTPILKDAQNAPILPHTITASITHCDHMSLTICSNKEHYIAIGIDCEHYLPKESLSNLIATPEFKKEQKILELLYGYLPQNIIFTILFSAKESLIKMYYQLTQRILPLSDINILSISLKQKSINAIINGSTYYVHFMFDNQHVISYTVLKISSNRITSQ